MNLNVRLMARSALFAALTAVCAMISIPLPPVRLTLQNFAVALGLLTLGGKWGTVSTLLYLLLGAAGLPVFAGFRGGFGALLDMTGGFLWGFPAGGAVYRLTEKWGKGLALSLFSLTCYACGCGWFMVCTGCDLTAALLGCVLPYLPGDAVKLTLARIIAKRIGNRIQKENK